MLKTLPWKGNGLMLKQTVSVISVRLLSLCLLLQGFGAEVYADRHDPTLPGNFNRPAASETAAGSIADNTAELILKVTEIWISDAQSRAIVNGMPVTAGQYLNEDIQIVKILPRRVIVKQRGETKTIYLVSSVKTP